MDRKLAKEGDAHAQFMLSRMYARGRGVKENEDSEVKWLLRAVDQGHLDAMYSLALHYESGGADQKDTVKALELYQRAASEGHVWSIFGVGRYYHYGAGGLEENIDEAIRHYRIAARKGHKRAAETLTKLGVSVD